MRFLFVIIFLLLAGCGSQFVMEARHLSRPIPLSAPMINGSDGLISYKTSLWTPFGESFALGHKLKSEFLGPTPMVLSTEFKLFDQAFGFLPFMRSRSIIYYKR